LIGVLESVILPPTEEGRIIYAIKAALPMTTGELIVALRPKFTSRSILNALGVLRETEEIRQDGKIWRAKVDLEAGSVV